MGVMEPEDYKETALMGEMCRMLITCCEVVSDGSVEDICDWILATAEEAISMVRGGWLNGSE